MAMESMNTLHILHRSGEASAEAQKLGDLPPTSKSHLNTPQAFKQMSGPFQQQLFL